MGVGTDPESKGVSLAGVTVTDTYTAADMDVTGAYLGTNPSDDAKIELTGSDGNYSFTFPADSALVAPQTITIVTRPSKDVLKNVSVEKGDATVENTVEMTAPETSTVTVPENTKDTESVTVSAPSLTKAGTQINADTIHYVIDVNKDGTGRILDAVVTDELKPDAHGNFAEFMEGTLHLRKGSDAQGTALTVYTKEADVPSEPNVSYATYIDNVLKVYFAGENDNPLSEYYAIEFDAHINVNAEYKDANFEFSNEASITGRFPYGDGTGPGPGIDWNMPGITTDFQVAYVEKETPSVNTATGVIDWTIEPSVRTDAYGDWTITDTISAGLSGTGMTIGTYTPASEGATAQADQTYDTSKPTLKVLDTKNSETGTDVTADFDITWSTVAVNNISTQQVSISPKEGKEKTHSINDIKVTLQTQAVNFLHENSKDHTYKNATHLTVQGTNSTTTAFEAQDDAERSLRNDFLSKTSSYSVVDDNNKGTSTGKIHYVIIINANNMDLNSPTFTDNLNNLTATAVGAKDAEVIPIDKWVLPTTVSYSHRAPGEEWNNAGSLTVADGKISTTETDANTSTNSYKVEFDIQLDSAYLAELQETLGGNFVIELSNTVTASSPDFDGGATVSVTDKTTAEAPSVINQMVSKTGTYASPSPDSKDPGKISYQIAINPNGANLESAVITDTLDPSIEIDLDSVTLYYATHDASGAISGKGAEVTPDAGSTTWKRFAADDDGNTVLQVDVPNGTASYVVTYDAVMVGKVNSVSNTVKLTSDDKPMGSETYEASVSSDSWGWLQYKAIYKFVKYDEFSGTSLPLKGVEFNLYSDEACTALVNFSKKLLFAGKTHSVLNATVEFQLYLYPNGYDNGKKVLIKLNDEGSGQFSYNAADGKETFSISLSPSADTGGEVSRIATLKGLPWGEYGIEEVMPAEGFASYEGEKRFSIDKETLKQNLKPTDTTSDLGDNATITNNLTELSIRKTADTGRDLSGAKLSIRGDAEGAPAPEGTGIATNPITGKAMTTIIPPETTTVFLWDLYGIAAGTYWLVEDTAPTDTQVGKFNPVQFTVDNYGKVTLATGADATLEGTTITVKDETAQVTVKKLDQFDNAVSGATLQLQKGSTAGETTSWSAVSGKEYATIQDDPNTPGDESIVTFAGLERDATYRIAEKKGDVGVGSGVPSGYKAAGGDKLFLVEFTIDEYGKVSSEGLDLNAETGAPNGAGTGAFGNWTLTNTVSGNEFTLRNEFIVGQVQFTKTDAQTPAKALSDVRFDLYKVNASEGDTKVNSDPLVSSDEGIVSTLQAPDTVTNSITGMPLNNGLTPGAYYFKEVSTHGDFALSTERVEFTVNEDGTNRYTWKTYSTDPNDENSSAKVPAGLVLGSGSPDGNAAKSLANTPLHANIKFNKTDSDRNANALGGAEFGLYLLNEKGEPAKTPMQTATSAMVAYGDEEASDSNGKTYTYDVAVGDVIFPNVSKGNYIIREITPAPGYTLNNTVLYASVTDESYTSNGSCFDITPTEKPATSSQPVTSVANKQTSLTINKVVGTTAVEANTNWSFTVKPVAGSKFVDGSLSLSVSKGSPTLRGKMIAGDTYTLTETTAPVGATALKEFTVTCNADGTFTLDRKNNAEADLSLSSGADGAIILTAVNHLSITGTKVWEDSSNKYGTRPAVSSPGNMLQLYIKKGEELTKVPGAVFSYTVGQNDEWKYTVTNIPQLGEGESYEIREDNVPTGYTADINTANVDNADAGYSFIAADITNHLETTKLTINKTWPASLPTEYVPDKVTVAIQQATNIRDQSAWEAVQSNGSPLIVELTEADKTEANTWEFIIDDLPAKNKQGATLYYRAVEQSLTYGTQPVVSRLGDSNVIGAFTVRENMEWSRDTDSGLYSSKTIICNELVTKNISATKTWSDANNQDGVRPDTVELTLAASPSLPSGITSSVNLSVNTDDAKNWKYTWQNLPVKTIAGEDITYTVTETSPEGYTSQYSTNGGQLTNGNAASTSLTNGNAAISFTNTHTPETVAVSAAKTWEDNADFGDRPDSVEMTLMASVNGSNPEPVTKDQAGDAVASKTLNGTTSPAWQAAWFNLPKNSAGKPITYTVVETPVKGYGTPGYSTLTAGTTGTITVTNTMEYTSLTVNKVWDADPLTGYSDNVKGVTVKLQRSTDGKKWSDVRSGESVVTKDILKNGVNTVTWDKLPAYDTGTGAEFQYRAVETALLLYYGGPVAVKPLATSPDDPTQGTVGGYVYTSSTSAASNNTPATTTITNTVQVTTLKAQKKWEDVNNQDGLRNTDEATNVEFYPVRIVENATNERLSAIGKTAATPVGSNESAVVTWNNLPITSADGKVKYTYSVVEGSLPVGLDGYTASGPVKDANDVFVITNSYTPAVKDVSISKFWVDDSNGENTRPPKLDITLRGSYLDGGVVKYDDY